MPTIDTGLRTLRHTCKPAAAILAGVTFASLGLTACGGSSGSTTSHANAAAAGTTAPTVSTTTSSRPGSRSGPNAQGGPEPSARSGPSAQSRPGFRQGLAKFAACLRQNGIDIPAPNTDGKGPIFSTKGIDTKSKQFRAATMKCRGALIGAFRRQPGSNGAAGP